MKQQMMKILCCPLCTGELELHISKKNKEDIFEGMLSCQDCKKEYRIKDGIPRMYISDSEIIVRSNSSEFSKFIITPENINSWVNSTIKRRDSKFISDHILTKFFLGLGWLLLLAGVFLFLLSSLVLPISLLLVIGVLLFVTSIILFSIDYYRYRLITFVTYQKELNVLQNLFNKHKLSEYDIRLSIQDGDTSLQHDLVRYNDIAVLKGKIIGSMLDSYVDTGKNLLNIGCGGILHQGASKPYFERGFNMVGVDVSEEYLTQFNQIFNAEVVQANCLALPFKDNSYDFVNCTSIIEHLHHPFLGLKEVQRGLKSGGGLILTANNHSTVIFRCFNPFVIFERILSLFNDSVLPPRKMLGQWKGVYFYHTEFSKNTISQLLKSAGFEIVHFKTLFIDKNRINEIFEKRPILRNLSIKWVSIFEKIPLFRFMCGDFFIMGKKPNN